MLTELINPEDLEPGDVIIYPSLTEMRTAKIVKKPNKITKTYNQGQYDYYKSTRCLVNVEYIPIPGYNRQNRTYGKQQFSIDEFNATKYIRICNPILKVIG
tara:strand:+ start:7000 stop:7302 length:303 start_codon:yes stop_codon:yes gene_type:complete